MTLGTLGQSDLKITPIGIAAWAIGGALQYSVPYLFYAV